MRAEAKRCIGKVQDANRRTFDRKRKAAHQYRFKNWAAIKRTLFATGAKIQPKYLGPYEVVRILRTNRYSLQKDGEGPGPISTSSAADFMMPWSNGHPSRTTSQDGPRVE